MQHHCQGRADTGGQLVDVLILALNIPVCAVQSISAVVEVPALRQLNENGGKNSFVFSFLLKYKSFSCVMH